MIARYQDLRRRGVYRITYIWHNYYKEHPRRDAELFERSQRACEKAGIIFKEQKYDKETVSPEGYDCFNVPLLTYATGTQGL